MVDLGCCVLDSKYCEIDSTMVQYEQDRLTKRQMRDRMMLLCMCGKDPDQDDKKNRRGTNASRRRSTLSIAPELDEDEAVAPCGISDRQ